jgi:hypothetical protein
MVDKNSGNRGQNGLAKMDMFNGLLPPLVNSLPAAQAGLELAALTHRRTQALMDLTTKTSRCRNTGDLANVATEFWQTAWTQHIASARKIAALFSLGLPAPTAAASKPTPVRDVMMIPEAATETAKPAFDWTDQTNRRAA